MTKLILSLAIALITGCATFDRLPTDYAGPDAGKVVISIGAASGTSYSSYSLLFRRRETSSVNDTKRTQGQFVFFQKNMFSKQKPDYQAAAESGVVLVQSLPPGSYEIFNFDIFFNAGTVQNNYSSKLPFSIPFIVRPGQTTYLGNYQANKMTGRNLFGIPLPAGAVFVVSNRRGAELAIAQMKDKSVATEATDATPDVKTV